MTRRRMGIDASGWWVGEKLSDEKRAELKGRWAEREFANERLLAKPDPYGHPTPEIASQDDTRGCKGRFPLDLNPASQSTVDLGATP